MPQLDLSFTITAIIAVTSLISPWISNCINNKHQKEMKLLEYEQERYNKTVVYKRQVFENYAAALGKAISNATTENIAEYGKCYGLARLYVKDSDAKKFMKDLHKSITSYDFNINDEDAELVLSEIASILEKLE